MKGYIMNYISFSLNGGWDMFYSEKQYTDEAVPTLTKLSHEPDCFVENAIPGYWEDMTEQFRNMPFFGKLKINPEYGVQTYPILGTAPDMALPNVMGNFFYSREVVLEDTASNVAIRFEGVQNSASVWINGTFIGRHEGYSTSFELDIPNGVLKIGENNIIISVSNFRLKGHDGRGVSGLTSRAANEYTGGVTGDVELRAYKTPLRDVNLLVSKELDRVFVKLETRERVKLNWQVYDGEEMIKSGEAEDDFSFDTCGMEYWSPENPKLYVLKVLCGEYGITRQFGVRRLVVDDVKFKLNGTPYFLRGICEHCYFPMTVHPTHDISFYRNVIKKIKELGFNFIRFHTYIPAEEYMQAADELGVLLHVESPNYTSVDEFREIVRFCRRHTSVVIYCCGNELSIDDSYTEYLGHCADAVHSGTDGLFSPLSALRRAEYFFPDCKTVPAPFEHCPETFEKLDKFSDMYSSYALGQLSYFSLDANPSQLDDWSKVYNKPRVSHEICIDGTYTDLSLKDRYKNTRVGKTEMFSSIEAHLEKKGLLEKAPLYFKNSSEWQRQIRKHCFESARLCDKLAGFDFLGPIDTHWHTFGYDVGMMNEFYELKPGETVENVLRYNSPTVVLCDLDKSYNFTVGKELSCGIYTSHYGTADLHNARLEIRLMRDGKVIHRESTVIEAIENGRVSKLYDLSFTLPMSEKPYEAQLVVTLDSGDIFAENKWDVYAFPPCTEPDFGDILISNGMTSDELIKALNDGRDVFLIGSEPFVSMPTDFRIALAGRTAGNLATVINDHPLTRDLPNRGFCSWQFCSMMRGGTAVCFEADEVPFEPIIEVVSTHKYVIRQSSLFEFRALRGRLIVCGMVFSDTDPCSIWFKSKIASYMQSDSFAPDNYIGEKELLLLMNKSVKKAEENRNFAFNPNDKATIE